MLIAFQTAGRPRGKNKVSSGRLGTGSNAVKTATINQVEGHTVMIVTVEEEEFSGEAASTNAWGALAARIQH